MFESEPMKAAKFLLVAAFMFFSGLGLLSAGPATPIPQWYYELSMADRLYSSGVGCTQDRPAVAIQDLKAAQAYANLAFSNGAGASATPLSEAISQALSNAEKALITVHTPEVPPVVSQPTRRYIRVSNAMVRTK
jgi:hypothetical protein